MAEPDWLRWLHATSASLEDCVALSLNLEPEWRRETKFSGSGVPTREEYAVAMAAMERGEAWTAASPPGRTTTKLFHPAHTAEKGPHRLRILRQHFDAKSPLLPAVAVPSRPGHSPAQRVRLKDFARFALAQDWDMPRKLACLPTDAAVDDATKPRKPLQRLPAQEEAIVAKLQELGFDPQALPLPPGKPSPVKRALMEGLGYSEAITGKAMTRLRKAGRIKEG